MKKGLSLLLVAVLGVAAYAADIEFVAGTTVGTMTQVTQNTPDEMTLSGVTVHSTYGAFNAGNAYRMGKNSVNTISCDQTITKVVFECLGTVGTSNYGGDGFAAMDGMTVSEDTKTVTWTGSATSIAFTASGHQVRASKIIVTISGEASSIAAPTFSPAAGTYTSAQQVTISAEEGATIYYTTNGADPLSTDEIYAGPINVDQSMTIKAIAVKGELTSAVATAAYVIAQVNTVANIAAFRALTDGETAAIGSELNVYYVSGDNVYVKDDSGYLCLYTKSKNASVKAYKVNDVIPAGIAGKKATYRDYIIEMADDFLNVPAASGKKTPVPEVVSASYVTTANTLAYIKIENVTIAEDSTKYYSVTDATGAKCTAYANTLATGTFDYIIGMITVYNGKAQLTPIEVAVPPTEIDGLSDLPSTADGVKYKIKNPVTVIAQSGQQLYITDYDANMLVYGSLEREYKNGDVLTGIMGTITVYNGMVELVPDASSFGAPDEGSEVEPEEIPVEEVSLSDMHKYLKYSEVTLTAIEGDTRNFTLNDGTGDLTVRINGFGVEYPTSFEGTFDVTGFVAVYKKNASTDAVLQFYPTEIKSNSQQFEQGDVNGDGVVSGADVTALYNVLLDGAEPAGNADVNGDGVVSGADVTALYNILLQ